MPFLLKNLVFICGSDLDDILVLGANGEVARCLLEVSVWNFVKIVYIRADWGIVGGMLQGLCENLEQHAVNFRRCSI